MDDDVGGPPVATGRRALGVAAGAGQPLGTGGQRAHGVGAALRHGARIVIADHVGHLHQPALEHRGVAGIQLAPHRGDLGVVVFVAHLEISAPGAAAGTPQRPRIVQIDPDVDGLGQLVIRQPAPLGGLCGQRGIDLGHRLTVGDQIGMPGDRRDDPIAHLAVGIQRRHLRQPVAQRQTQSHLAGCLVVPHPQRAGDLGGHRVPAVAGPFGALALLVAAPAGQLGDRRAAAAPPQRPPGAPTPGWPPHHHRRVVGVTQRLRLRRQSIEHAFDCRCLHRQPQTDSCRRGKPSVRTARTRRATGRCWTRSTEETGRRGLHRRRGC